jgi:hypothetical protein
VSVRVLFLPHPVIKGPALRIRRLEMMKKLLRVSGFMTIVLFALLPVIFTFNQPTAEAAKAREQSARASWTKCKSNICVDTVIIATDPGGKKTLSFKETTYRKNGEVVFRRGGFAAKDVKFQQEGLEKAQVDASVKVDRCNAQDVCKKAGTVHITASWTGRGSTWVDKELGKKLRDAKVEGSVDGQSPGSPRYALLTKAMNGADGADGADG